MVLTFDGKSVVTKDAKTRRLLPVSGVQVLVTNIVTSNITMRTEFSDLCYFTVSAALSRWERVEFFSQLSNVLFDSLFVIRLIGRHMEDFKMDSSVKPVSTIRNEAIATALLLGRVKLQRNLKLALA